RRSALRPGGRGPRPGPGAARRRLPVRRVDGDPQGPAPAAPRAPGAGFSGRGLRPEGAPPRRSDQGLKKNLRRVSIRGPLECRVGRAKQKTTHGGSAPQARARPKEAHLVEAEAEGLALPLSDVRRDGRRDRAPSRRRSMKFLVTFTQSPDTPPPSPEKLAA